MKQNQLVLGFAMGTNYTITFEQGTHGPGRLMQDVGNFNFADTITFTY